MTKKLPKKINLSIREHQNKHKLQ